MKDLWIVLILGGLCFGISSACNIIEGAPPGSDCTSYRQVLNGMLLETASLFFAENPRTGEPPLNPSEVDPLTAVNLYRHYYGEGASPRAFNDVILRIQYADPGTENVAFHTSNNLEYDRTVLRDRIYSYVLGRNFDLAREKFGLLLYRDLSDVGDELWIKYRCVLNKNIQLVQSIIASEIAKLRKEVGESNFGKFLDLGRGTTLAFAIDDTGSMSEEIEAVRRRSTMIIDERQGLLDAPENFVLVPFNDPKIGPVTVTSNSIMYKNAINRMSAHGGGDLPELSMAGIQKAIENSRPDSTVYIITDAEAKDAELQNGIIAEANRKRIKLVFMLTERMATWLCAGFSSTRRLAACRDPSLKLGFELYEHLANTTGGQILVIRRNDIFKATELVDILLKHGTVNLDQRRLTRDTRIDIFVDSDMTELYLEASGRCNSIKLLKEGKELESASSVRVDTLYVVKWNLTSFGKHQLAVRTKTGCSIKVIAKSTKGFTQSLAEESTNEEGSKCLNVFYNQPLNTEKVTFLIDMYGLQIGDLVNSIIFVDDDTDETLHTFRVTTPSERHFRVNLDPFDGRRVVTFVSGVDASGYQFRRAAQASVKFVSVEIDCSALDSLVFRPGGSTQVAIVIKNLNTKEDYFTVGASDDQDFITSISQARILVGGGASEKFYVRLRAPDDAPSGIVDTLTITAKGSDDSIVFNKQCRLPVGQKQKTNIDSFNIVTNINSRFAETTVQSKISNDAWIPREALFHVIIPANAYVTEFTMTIDGVKYPGVIKEIGEANEIFEDAKTEGITAGQVTARGKSARVFETSVNLEADEKVLFELKYQELLRRVNGKFHNEINVQTNQPVGELIIEVNIWESQPLTPVEVLGFNTDQSSAPGGVNLEGVRIQQSGNTAKVSYRPTKEQQTQFSPLGLNGKFIVQYDVLRTDDKMSSMVAFDRTFVHFINPELNSMRKRVVFLLDNSGSMFGRKLEQLISAMKIILNGLHPEDAFAILTYNNEILSWDPHPKDDERSIMVPASPANIVSAKRFLRKIQTKGGSDILQALEIALNVVEGYAEDEKIDPNPSTDFIFMLTDGEPTEGEMDSNSIVTTISKLNAGKYGIHTIGFGALADPKLLAKIASRNRGSFIQIFNDIDAYLQISNFFETFASPMLRNVKITYADARINQTTGLVFNEFNGGTEITIAGQFANGITLDSFTGPGGSRIDTTLTAKSDSGDVLIEESVTPLRTCTSCDAKYRLQQEKLVERLEKYMELLNILRQMDAGDDETMADELRERAVKMAIESKFVVPEVTSIVIAKPNDEEEIVEIIKEEDETLPRKDETLPSTVAPLTTVPTTTTQGFFGASVATAAFGRIPFTTLTPFTASRPRLEFFGDPHFVIDIEEQITLCFNWEGKDGQNINLLHDPVKGITVNGRLVTSRAPEESARQTRTYVNKLGISFRFLNMSITVTSRDIVLRLGSDERVSLMFGKYGTKKRKSVTLKVKPITKYKSTLFIHLHKNIVFRVISRINSKNKYVKDHLDFAILKGDGLTKDSVGVLGQFSRFKADKKQPASIEFGPDGNTAMLWYRNNPVEVSYHMLKDYNSDKEVECWYMANKDQLWENDEDIFLVNGILDKPKSQKI